VPSAPPYPYGGPWYVAPDTRNNYSHSIYAGLDHTFRSDLTFSGRAGIQIVDYYNAPAGNPGNSVTPYADLSLNYAYTQGGSLVVGFRNSHNQTDLGATPVVIGTVQTSANITLDEVSSTAYLNLTQTLTPISPNLVGSVSFQYQNSKFESGPYGGETDNFYLLGLNLTYQFTHWISTELGYNYDLLDSDVPNRGYYRDRVYIGVTATY